MESTHLVGPPTYRCGIFGPPMTIFKVCDLTDAKDMVEFYNLMMPQYHWVIFETWPYRY